MNVRETSNRQLVRRLLATTLAGALVCCSCASAQEKVSVDDLPLLAKMRAQGVDASVTVLPVLMVGRHNRDVGDVVGAMLEKDARMGSISSTDAVFAPPAGRGAEKIPELLGEWVKQNPIKSDYALYAEIDGTPQTGPTEIRIAIATKDGEPVWFDRQTPESSTFKRIKPSNPMSCCVLITERVKAALDVPRAGDKKIENGRMEKLWAEKSGTPSKAEYEAIDARLQTLCKQRGEAKLLVYPAQLNDESGADTAKKLADAAKAAGFTNVRTADENPSFKIEPSSNEQRLLWDMARAFQNYVREHKPDADYALFAHYMLSEEHQHVGAVHFVICSRAGDWVAVDFQNNHHDDFNSVNPKTSDDCTKLVAKRLERWCK